MLILINWVTSWKNINIDFEDIKTTDHIMEIPGLSELLLCFLLTKNEMKVVNQFSCFSGSLCMHICFKCSEYTFCLWLHYLVKLETVEFGEVWPNWNQLTTVLEAYAFLDKEFWEILILMEYFKFKVLCSFLQKFMSMFSSSSISTVFRNIFRKVSNRYKCCFLVYLHGFIDLSRKAIFQRFSTYNRRTSRI